MSSCAILARQELYYLSAKEDMTVDIPKMNFLMAGACLTRRVKAILKFDSPSISEHHLRGYFMRPESVGKKKQPLRKKEAVGPGLLALVL